MNPQVHSALFVLLVYGVIGAAISGTAIVLSDLLDRRGSRRCELELARATVRSGGRRGVR